eukprot:TRINITY_DN3610_c0_g1_i2.p1 TRINITY_DN3610_c0_g1~~TRINITY_DN3610_c0_g1_i2.p1  ORF type:complete len:432 (+),score=77.91 TRINITY_DN3610_c0_g1_i2:166-1461(+)
MRYKNYIDAFIDYDIIAPILWNVELFAKSVAVAFGLVEREVALLFYNIRYGFPGHSLMPDIPRFVSTVVGNTAVVGGAVGSMYFGADILAQCVCKRACKACSGWKALRCTMCNGSGKVPFHLRNFSLKDGEVATSRTIATAIVDGRADVEHLPASCGFESALPTTECPTCSGSGVMNCPKCGSKFAFKLSYERIFNVPWNTWNVLRTCELPSEHILEGIENPDVAAFRLIARPELEGGFQYDEDVKQKISWKYKEFMRYEAARKFVANREPGWEHMQKLLFALNPMRARADHVVVRDIPYFKAKQKLEAEVMALQPPSRPPSWTPLHMKKLSLALDESEWTGSELEDQNNEMETSRLSSWKKQSIENLLDLAWEKYWRKQKYDELVEEKVKPYLEKMKDGVYPIDASKEHGVVKEVPPKRRFGFLRWRKNQ